MVTGVDANGKTVTMQVGIRVTGGPAPAFVTTGLPSEWIWIPVGLLLLLAGWWLLFAAKRRRKEDEEEAQA